MRVRNYRICLTYMNARKEKMNERLTESTKTDMVIHEIHLLPTFIIPLDSGSGRQAWKIETFVTFGDSYPNVLLTGDSGTAWPIYVARYGNLPFIRSHGPGYMLEQSHLQGSPFGVREPAAAVLHKDKQWVAEV